MSDSPTTHLSEQECWSLLADQELGRLAYHLTDEVHITPVNYAVDHGRLIFRTAEGSKLLGVVMDSDVAFEIDQVDDDAETAWSVVARGTAELLEGPEAREVANLRLRPWIGDEKVNVVAITVTEVSGRRFGLSRPWRHLRRHG
ncbi:pyridoxamine 5'-phosphate oxidase family protein [Serinicoccus hydrothermalis]|uniref:pyridoxamine 5'-phosphate oxidase family protein n=1 Tax=Serinicoccus hydrothermalis TaxID=1758689 RepID=UPI0008333375|nr:pyridoxamine 5'-phosphate oxidase family protein [Serinicoccus hydrothermalis]